MSDQDINMEELMDKIIDPKDFEVISKLGKGQYGEVFKVKEGSNFYALKKIIDYNKTNYIREIAILARLDHPSILGFRGFALPYNKQPAIIITEFLSGGDLTEAIKKSPPGWNDTKKMINIYGIAKGMEYCHQHNVLHRDLKPDNILLDSRLEPHIADFGLSKLANPEEQMLQSIQLGTPTYSAPEFLRDNVGDEKMDVYSFAVIVYFILTGREPFQEITNQFKFITQIESGIRDEIPSDVPEMFTAMIQQCWTQDPTERPTFSQILSVISEPENYDPEFIEKVNLDEFLEYKERVDNCVRLNEQKEEQEEKVKIEEREKIDELSDSGKEQELLEINNLLDEAKQLEDGNDMKAAAKIYAKVADKGDPRGRFNYGKYLKMGAGVKLSLPLAELNFKAVSDGDSDLAIPALIELGNVYEMMNEPETALNTFKEAMDKGSDLGRSNYARMLAYGLGTPQDLSKAVELLNKSVENNDGLGLALLGKLYIEGKGVPQDKKKAIELFERSSELKCAEGNNELADCYLKGNGVETDMKKAAMYYTKSADDSNIVGLFNLAKMANEGLGMKKDFKYAIELLHRASRLGCIDADIEAGNFFLEKGKESKAFRCFKKAADAENPEAEMIVGKMYRYGYGVDVDYKNAVNYLSLGAKHGNPEAMQLLGRCYEEGQGVSADQKKALELFKESADLNFVSGLDCYARFLLSGTGMDQPEPAKAIEILKKAAELGSDTSAFNLATLLYEGKTKDVPKDKKEALKYFQIAMDAGNKKAAFLVAKILKDGKGGVTKNAEKSAEILQSLIDDAECSNDTKINSMVELASIHYNKMIKNSDIKVATKYFKVAADNGITYAQTMYGYLLESGNGVTQDINEAKKYFAMAAEKGDQYAKSRLDALK